MTSRKWDAYFRSFFDIDGFSSADNSLNGIQVDNDGSEITKIAFAVDASLETFERAVASGAGMIFVHHGLFWGKPLALTGNHRKRIQCLLGNNVALYALHLPLDQHPELGNNAALIDMLGVKEPKPFGCYHGKMIGYQGTLSAPLTVEEAVKKISFMGRPPLGVFPFGKKENLTCAVISGGASNEVMDAIQADVDLYVTGETSHEMYHHILESKINMVSGGHYSTEVWGVRRVMERVASDTSAEVEFIDVPTGL
jgi:dinuclear metal center YbgI/SA1388 family protein